MRKYYCRKCKRVHQRGKVYKEHLEYKKEEQNNVKPQADESNQSSEITELSINELRPIAKRQLKRLYKKIESTKNRDFQDHYKNQIKKLIETELR